MKKKENMETKIIKGLVGLSFAFLGLYLIYAFWQAIFAVVIVCMIGKTLFGVMENMLTKK